MTQPKHPFDTLLPLRERMSMYKHAVERLLASHSPAMGIDAYADLVGPCYASASSLMRAKMWAGEAMKALGSHSPYKSSEIQRQAGTHLKVPGEREKVNDVPEGFPIEAHIVTRIDWLRANLDSEVQDLERFFETVSGSHGDRFWFLEDLLQVRVSVKEARQMLGIVLGRLRDLEIVETLPEPPPIQGSPRIGGPAGFEDAFDSSLSPGDGPKLTFGFKNPPSA